MLFQYFNKTSVVEASNPDGSTNSSVTRLISASSSCLLFFIFNRISVYLFFTVLDVASELSYFDITEIKDLLHFWLQVIHEVGLIRFFKEVFGWGSFLYELLQAIIINVIKISIPAWSFVLMFHRISLFRRFGTGKLCLSTERLRRHPIFNLFI